MPAIISDEFYIIVIGAHVGPNGLGVRGGEEVIQGCQAKKSQWKLIPWLLYVIHFNLARIKI